ncbi:peptidoglycan DD-metalloendopeptidase family protein [Aestuariivirga sp.]|uniref:peptidoglycan DD-metalloendopeptidase family protein n=1 Tax=Aestuariivirga sp. TaxID=2650926 RepID=UPI003919E56F
MPLKVRSSAWNASRSKFLLSVAAAVMLAACSAESDRFASNPSDADPVYTASVPKQVTAANVGMDDEISSKPLTGASQQPPSYDYSKSYRTTQYRQPAVAATPDVAEAPSAAGGRTVTVGPGMTLYSVARANNVSVSQLAAANGIRAPYSVRTGQTLRIPAGGSGQATAYAEPETAPAPAKPFKQGPSVTDSGKAASHTVASGETLFSLGRKYGLSPYAIAEANGLPRDAQLAVGQRVRIPGGSASAAPAVAVKKQAAQPKLETAAVTAEDETEVAAVPAAPQKAAAAVEQQPAETAGQQVSEQAPIAGAPGLRWPVRGKVISGFGPKANGLKNEGINIAVPEGTSIRAADSGVVAYSGNELKGYGNLVLIRHENGYVTAYAHAKELFVKRGDTVKRGDVIAKAGQTGSVSSPQLHFEVRKGAVALDPMKYLSSSTAAN